tara:strand:- start:2689 stop:2997 length:309 start_codon:yes stop_codon:yes gene_type:complete
MLTPSSLISVSDTEKNLSIYGVDIKIIRMLYQKNFFFNLYQIIHNVNIDNIIIGKNNPRNDIGQRILGLIYGDIIDMSSIKAIAKFRNNNILEIIFFITYFL